MESRDAFPKSTASSHMGSVLASKSSARNKNVVETTKK